MLAAKRDNQSGKRRWSWWTMDFQAVVDKAKVGDTVSIPHVKPYPTLDDFNERIMKPALENAALTCRNDMITGMIQQLQAFIDHSSVDENQMKRLAKISKHLRKMGWPKTAIDVATWRKVNQGVET